ncbi:hypothetical protein [Companilactobacillus bobalius]|uniref:hypothetical protein n=1 Tax=Companilactobacillus bobalius TaxID=2801451 RepID=UPI00130253EB|nr:hypothetical protein [Companilactobacillus bobalius]KAE9560649.1 hypothetical protein ATN92_10965 [Companilactobacillus bobalius]
MWAHIDSEEKETLATVVSNYSSKMNSISKKETSFSSDYLNKWSSWLKSVTSSFMTPFNFLHGVARITLSKVTSEIKKGIFGEISLIVVFAVKSLKIEKYVVCIVVILGGVLDLVGVRRYVIAHVKTNVIFPVGL